MDKKIKLNLGCGIFYKPGYVNIDFLDDSVADIVCNADDLPFVSNSIDLIESYHLIEHFDYINCKYLISEWFRTLRPNGKLIIETPELEKSFKKFLSADLETKKKTLQWIYGIDNPGMHHKTGFTYKLLKEILEEIGFKEIKKNVPLTHKYEPGLRVECIKPENNKKSQFFTEFRKKTKEKLSIDEPNLLSSLEENCIIEIKDILYNEFDKDKKKVIRKIISKTVTSNPLISLIFCEKCIEFEFFSKNEIKNEINLIKYLVKINFHKKLLNLWKKTNKRIGENKTDFIKFLYQLQSKVTKSIDRSNHDEFIYIENLETENILIFNFHVVQLQALILSNKGIKEFSKKNYNKSIDYLLDSVQLFSDNQTIYWNLARLFIITDQDEKNIIDSYEKSLFLDKNKKLYNSIKKEFELFKKNSLNKNSLKPVEIKF